MKYITLSLSIILLSLCNFIFAQSADGYWDTPRAYYKELTLGAGYRAYYRVDLPAGTTEIVYRITLLDENQQMADRLSDGLSNVTGGLSNLISLTSQVVGSDKCYYTIFNKQEDADAFYETGQYSQGCYIKTTAINKDVVNISVSKDECMSTYPSSLWFGIKSANLLMDEHIVLEVSFFVNKKLSTGWTPEIKKAFIEKCSEIDVDELELNDKEKFCACLLDKLQKDYSVADLQNLVSSEFDKIGLKYGKECMVETGEIDNFISEASDLLEERKYDEAIDLLLDLESEIKNNSNLYNELGYALLLSKQYLKALKYLKEGEKLDAFDLLIKGNIAHAYLLNGEYEQAKTIYLKYKSQNIDSEMSWIQMVEADFIEFRKNKIDDPHFDEILNLLKN